MRKTFLCLLTCLCVYANGYAQDTTKTSIPGSFLSKLTSKTTGLDNQLSKQVQKYMRKLAAREARLQKKLYAYDSVAAKNLYASNPQQAYLAYGHRVATDTVSAHRDSTGVQAPRGDYLPHADSMRCSLAFLRQHPELLSSNQAQIQQSINELGDVQSKMADAGQAQQFAEARQLAIKQYLQQYTQLPSGITDAYHSYETQLYYYNQQLAQYKATLDNPDQWASAALSILDKVPAFTSFVQQNSMLSSLFPTSANNGSVLALTGLQTRANIQQVFQGQLAAGPNAQGALTQSADQAQSEMSQLKDKLMQYGSGGGSVDDPNFKPNGQKTKTFLKRLEYGINIQTVHGSYYYPTTTDLALTVGYKLNDNNSIGIGASYNIGWGTDIHHVAFSSQGVGLRSYVDIKLKKTYYLSGGFEYNYQQPFYSTDIFRTFSDWQQSGLIGISKIVKKTKIQVLWDFLSYYQVPKTQPILLRVGYSF